MVIEFEDPTVIDVESVSAVDVPGQQENIKDNIERPSENRE